MRILNFFLLIIMILPSGSCIKDTPSIGSEETRLPEYDNSRGNHQEGEKEKDAKTYTYLALGDSYTIGQSVPSHLNFPNQVVSFLENRELKVAHPKIIAVTGWTTDNLEAALKKNRPSENYDVVTLLIGVNDQYVGYTLAHYREGFERLLKQAITYAGGKADHVIVLSIPDWGVTPFAKGTNRSAIAKEIKAFNEANFKISKRYKVRYLNITPDTKKMGEDQHLVASDGLHPSGTEYFIWSKKLSSVMEDVISR